MTGDKRSISSTILSISVRTLINVLLVLFLVEGFTEAYRFSSKLFMDIPYKAATSDTVNVTIKDGMDAQQLAGALTDLGIVEGKALFLARVYIGGYADKIQAGVYQLGPGMSPDEICREICGMQSEETT